MSKKIAYCKGTGDYADRLIRLMFEGNLHTNMDLTHGEPPGVLVCGSFIIPRVRQRLFFIVLVHLTIVHSYGEIIKYLTTLLWESIL